MAKYEIKDGVGIIPEGTTVVEAKAFADCELLIANTFQRNCYWG
jgi:hypothetical protein